MFINSIELIFSSSAAMVAFEQVLEAISFPPFQATKYIGCTRDADHVRSLRNPANNTDDNNNKGIVILERRLVVV